MKWEDQLGLDSLFDIVPNNQHICIVHQLAQQNQFGKTQSDLDLKAEEIIVTHLKKSGVVHSTASEENPFVSDS